jgi:hypothetical protein
MSVAILIDAAGRTQIHKSSCERFRNELETAQGPAGYFPGILDMMRSFVETATDDRDEDGIAPADRSWCDCVKEPNGKQEVGKGNDRTSGSVRGAGSVKSGTGTGDGSTDRHSAGGRQGGARLDRSATNGSGPGTRAVGQAAGALSKPERFAADAKEAGWDPEVTHDGSITTVTARRGEQESIAISWDGEACRSGSLYRLGSYERTLRNAAACRRQLLVPEDEAQGSVAKRKARRVGTKSASARPVRAARVDSLISDDDFDEEDEERYQGNVPFDSDAAAAEIFAAVIGREIHWKSSINRTVYAARVMAKPEQRQLRIERHPRSGQRILTFAAEDEGFRSVYISSIIDVR